MTTSVMLDNYQTRHCLEDITEHFFDEGEKGKVYLTTAEHVSLLTWFKVNYDAWREGSPIYPLLIEREFDNRREYLEVTLGNPNDHERLKIQVGGYDIATTHDHAFLLVNSRSRKPLLYQGLAVSVVPYTYNGKHFYRPAAPRTVCVNDEGRFIPPPAENKQ